LKLGQVVKVGTTPCDDEGERTMIVPKAMNVLITGGAGFIGSHIAERLVQAGHSVAVLDNFSSGKRQNLEPLRGNVEVLEGDIRDAARVREAVKGREVIFHEAAIVSVPYSVEHPLETHDVNILGTLQVLEAARHAGVRRVVFASSAAIYGAEPTLPKVETMLPTPIAPYGVEKVTAEHYLHTWSAIYGVETVALRYFNVFGPRQDPSSAYSGVISIFVDRALDGRPLTIFGDGQASRDFVFVGDVVDANLKAATRDGVSGEVFNVARGNKTTLDELASTLGRVVGRALSVEHAAPRVGDIVHSWANVGKAKSRLGFEAKVSVEDGLRELVLHVRRERDRK
jgi:nucleoside-diphosphate-sugar epimerase